VDQVENLALALREALDRPQHAAAVLAAPRVALDLPLKTLVWEDGEGRFGFLTIARST
jgi:hypothetical protein